MTNLHQHFGYGETEEMFYGNFATRQAAIDYAKSQGIKTIFTCEYDVPNPCKLLSADDFITKMTESPDFSTENAEQWVGDLQDSRKALDRLTDAIQGAISDWLDKEG